MVINADGEEVPGILFNGVAYELEMIGASDVESLVKCIRVDKRFSDFATRINKVCRGIAGKWWAHLFNIEECNGCSSQISLPEYDLGTTWLIISCYTYIYHCCIM